MTIIVALCLPTWKVGITIGARIIIACNSFMESLVAVDVACQQDGRSNRVMLIKNKTQLQIFDQQNGWNSRLF